MAPKQITETSSSAIVGNASEHFRLAVSLDLLRSPVLFIAHQNEGFFAYSHVIKVKKITPGKEINTEECEPNEVTSRKSILRKFP